MLAAFRCFPRQAKIRNLWSEIFLQQNENSNPRVDMPGLLLHQLQSLCEHPRLEAPFPYQCLKRYNYTR